MRRVGFAAGLATLGGHAWLAYGVERSDLAAVWGAFAVLTAAYLVLLRPDAASHRAALGWAVAARLVWLLALPPLSDDYHRFVWDGHLLVAGENPYLVRPDAYLARPPAARLPALDSARYAQLNSPHYYTVYPPLGQAVFALAVAASPASWRGAVVGMRLVLLLAELGSLILLIQLLGQFGLPLHRVRLYALHPLVIAELTGNLHFEALLIFFLLLAGWALARGAWAGAAVAWGLAVLSKLTPLLLLPLLFFRLGWRRAAGFYALTGLTVLAGFGPFLSPALIHHMGQSLNLYFETFEFNASLYYLARWVGYQLTGYNPIATVGPWLSRLAVVGLLALALSDGYRRGGRRAVGADAFPARLLLVGLTLYYLLATTVHPWYLTTLVALSVLTPYRFAVVWALASVLSYHVYQTEAYTEQMGWVVAEYALALGWLGWELRQQRAITARRDVRMK